MPQNVISCSEVLIMASFMVAFDTELLCWTASRLVRQLTTVVKAFFLPFYFRALKHTAFLFQIKEPCTKLSAMKMECILLKKHSFFQILKQSKLSCFHPKQWVLQASQHLLPFVLSQTFFVQDHFCAWSQPDCICNSTCCSNHILPAAFQYVW